MSNQSEIAGGSPAESTDFRLVYTCDAGRVDVGHAGLGAVTRLWALIGDGPPLSRIATVPPECLNRHAQPHRAISITGVPDAKTRYEKNSVREYWAARVLLIGLFIDTVILLIFPNGKSVLESGLELLACVLVFCGVLGEIHFAAKAKSADDELKRAFDKQVAESNRLAAEANQKAETERVQRLKLELELREVERRNAVYFRDSLYRPHRAAHFLRAQKVLLPRPIAPNQQG
jgi:hypothetical protein